MSFFKKWWFEYWKTHGLTVRKWMLVVWPKIPQMPQNLSVQFVCPSPKVLDFIKKRLHWASVVRVYIYNAMVFETYTTQTFSHDTDNQWIISKRGCDFLFIFLQSPHQVDIKSKNVVKWWKDFLLYLFHHSRNITWCVKSLWDHLSITSTCCCLFAPTHLF